LKRIGKHIIGQRVSFKAFFLGALLMLSLGVMAQTASFKAVVQRNPVPENESFQLTFIIENMDAQSFSPPKFEGFNVVAAARRINLLEEIQKDIIQKYNVEIAVKECDVTNESACKELMEFCIEKFSRIDVLINNAGDRQKQQWHH